MKRLYATLLCALAVLLVPALGARASLRDYGVLFTQGERIEVNGVPLLTGPNEGDNDRVTKAYDMGFTFWLDGKPYNSFSVSDNGLIGLGNTAVTGCWVNQLNTESGLCDGGVIGYDIDVATGERTVRKQLPVLDGFDPSAYATAREWATADDGTEVPISIVWRPDAMPAEGPAPCLLYGYGAYEVTMDPWFSIARLSLLDRGVVFAIAHVRGGGELGRRWYEDGKFGAKANTFSDFVACARHLCATGRTAPEVLAARGGSAGGLLMGAATNLAPEQFRAVVAEVPFVDPLTTMLDPSLPLTVIEWEEWGDPLHDPEAYGWLKGYSPYENVRDAEATYPAILATAGLNDPRVGYHEPTKWVARLRDQGHEALFKVELGAGHGGPTGRYDAWRDEAFVLGFVLRALDVA